MTSSIAAALAVTIAFSGSPVELPTEAPVEETVAVEAIVEEAPAEAEVVADEAPVSLEEVAPEAAVEVAPVIVMPDISTPFAGVEPLVPTEGLIPLGIRGSFQPSPGAPVIEHDRYMLQPRNAHITGLAKPKTSTGTRPDEPVIDLRSLVGNLGGPNRDRPETGFGFTAEGALASTPSHRAATGGDYPEPLDWSEYTWRLEGIGAVGLMDTSNIDGKVALVPFAENAQYGVRATLIHTATGVEAEAIEITGYSGTNSGGGFDWVGGAQRNFDGGIPLWDRYEESSTRDNRYLSWSNPFEVISATGTAETTATAPAMVPGLRGEFTGNPGVPAGFGLWNIDGNVQAGVSGNGASHRIGQLHGAPVETVTFDLAASIPGAVAVGLPGAPTGVLTLDPSTAYQYNTVFGGLDYQAPSGVTLTASGTTVTATFGSAEWLNRVGIVVPVLMADGFVEWAELRTESLPRDIAGGVVEKSIPVSTELLITDTELLEASRLTGLTPSLAEVRAAELPEGVTRVAGGFAYAGSEEPTTLAFGFTVAETVETQFGPVRPDSAGPGEVRIAVVEGAVVPTDPEPETPVVVTPPTEVTPTPKPETVTPSKAGPRTDGNTAGTGDGGFIAAEETDEGISNLVPVGIFGAFMLAVGAVSMWLFGRRKAGQAKA